MYLRRCGYPRGSHCYARFSNQLHPPILSIPLFQTKFHILSATAVILWKHILQGGWHRYAQEAYHECTPVYVIGVEDAWTWRFGDPRSRTYKAQETRVNIRKLVIAMERPNTTQYFVYLYDTESLGFAFFIRAKLRVKRAWINCKP
jgi:hypothetical protein